MRTATDRSSVAAVPLCPCPSSRRDYELRNPTGERRHGTRDGRQCRQDCGSAADEREHSRQSAGDLIARQRADASAGQYLTAEPVKRAPAWFYRALCWLGKSYFDAANSERGFSPYLIGADVDPYRRLERFPS